MPLPAGPLYVHFDSDFLALEDAPAMNYPAPGGPPATLIRAAFQRLAASGQVAGISFSAWNPELDGASSTEMVCMELLRVLAGPD
jgi:arginase family enzyme